MAHFYRITFLYFTLTILTEFWVAAPAQAQSDELVSHKIWVKLNSPVSELRYPLPQRRGRADTGKPSLDQLGRKYGVVGIRRLFSPSPKFEKGHRRYGLHLWYELEFADTLSTSVKRLASLYRKNVWVTRAEAIPVRLRYHNPALAVGPKPPPTILSDVNDPRYPEQWHFNNSGQSGGTPGADIRLASAWPYSRGNEEVIVAVIDGGIDTQHEDLRDALWVNEAELRGNPDEDDDGNGYVDDIYGYGFGDGRGDIYADQHGTHVAGTIGAVSNNNVGVSGIAGGDGKSRGVKLMSCAVFGRHRQGGFPEAFVYAADHGAVIAQNSWGGGDESQVLEDAIAYFTERAGYDNTNEKFDQRIQIGPMAGGLVIFAAGNNNSSRANVAYPASLNSVMTVTSLDDEDKKSDFANYGEWVDIAAPGSKILSTFPGNSYGYLSGTSMACPQVSGVAALAVSRYQRPGFTGESLRRLLLRSVDNVDASNEDYTGLLGSGRINAYRVLSPDNTLAPEPVTDLVSSGITFESVVLHWTAAGGSSASGPATYFELKGSPQPIQSSGFHNLHPIDTIIYAHPGTDYAVKIAGLSPEATYYFALKAVNIAGQRSALSNTVTVRTASPPQIRISPRPLTAGLEAGQMKTDTLLIDNSRGESPLIFRIVSPPISTSEPWVRIAVDSGYVAAGEFQEVAVRWNARSLNAGEYRSTLRVVSNDPERPDVEVPLQLSVVGYPSLQVSVSTLDFGNVYLTFSRTVSLTLRNSGTDTLKVEDMTTETSVFRTVTQALPIAPGEHRVVPVVFTPARVGHHEDTLFLLSNDPSTERYAVPLMGQGLTPPLLLPDPEEILAEVEEDRVLLRNVRLQNTSLEDSVRWIVDGELPDWLSFSAYSGKLAPREVSELPITLSARENDPGDYSTEVNLRLSDEESVILPVTLTVVPPNQLPVWSDSLLRLSVRIDEPETRVDLRRLARDPEGGELLFEYQGTSNAHALVQVAGSDLLIRPLREGVTRGAMVATDRRGGQVPVEAIIEVLPANRPPVPVSTTVEVALSLTDPPFTVGLDSLFSDPDEDSLIYRFTRPYASPDHPIILEDSVVRLTMEGGSLLGQPHAVGETKVIVYAYDPAGTYSSVQIAFTVRSPNRAPQLQRAITSPPLTEQEQYTVDLNEFFTDPDKDLLMYEATVADTTVARTTVASASLTIRAGIPGTTRITITARDEAGGSVSYSFNLRVSPVIAVASEVDQPVLKVYPNPATDQVTVAYPGIQMLRIYSPQGQLLAEKAGTPDGKLDLTVTSLPPGVYLLVAVGRDRIVARTTLLKQ